MNIFLAQGHLPRVRDNLQIQFFKLYLWLPWAGFFPIATINSLTLKRIRGSDVKNNFVIMKRGRIQKFSLRILFLQDIPMPIFFLFQQVFQMQYLKKRLLFLTTFINLSLFSIKEKVCLRLNFSRLYFNIKIKLFNFVLLSNIILSIYYKSVEEKRDYFNFVGVRIDVCFFSRK